MIFRSISFPMQRICSSSFVSVYYFRIFQVIFLRETKRLSIQPVMRNTGTAHEISFGISKPMVNYILQGLMQEITKHISACNDCLGKNWDGCNWDLKMLAAHLHSYSTIEAVFIL